MSHLVWRCNHKFVRLLLAFARNQICGLKKHTSNRYCSGVRCPGLRTNTTARLLARTRQMPSAISAVDLGLIDREASVPTHNPAIHSGDRHGGGILLGPGGACQRTVYAPSRPEQEQHDSTRCQSLQRAHKCLAGRIASGHRLRC